MARLRKALDWGCQPGVRRDQQEMRILGRGPGEAACLPVCARGARGGVHVCKSSSYVGKLVSLTLSSPPERMLLHGE